MTRTLLLGAFLASIATGALAGEQERYREDRRPSDGYCVQGEYDRQRGYACRSDDAGYARHEQMRYGDEGRYYGGPAPRQGQLPPWNRYYATSQAYSYESYGEYRGGAAYGESYGYDRSGYEGEGRGYRDCRCEPRPAPPARWRHARPAPVYVERRPIYIESAPVYVRPAPIHVASPPIYVQGPPVYVEQPPIYIDPPQVHVTPSPVHVAPPEIHVRPPEVIHEAPPAPPPGHGGHHGDLPPPGHIAPVAPPPAHGYRQEPGERG